MKILPSTIKAKLFWGFLFMLDAELEITLGFQYIPRYYIEIVGPIDTALFLSTAIASILGGLFIGKGILQATPLIKARLNK